MNDELVTVWGYVIGSIGVHNPNEDGVAWDFTHLPTGRRIGAVATHKEQAQWIGYVLNEVKGVESDDLAEVKRVLTEWCEPLPMLEKLKELAG